MRKDEDECLTWNVACYCPAANARAIDLESTRVCTNGYYIYFCQLPTQQYFSYNLQTSESKTAKNPNAYI